MAACSMSARVEAIGSRCSLLLGFPTGVAAVSLTIALSAWITGEGLFAVYPRFFGDATAWLLLVFPFALWAAGAEMARAIVDGVASRAVCIRYTVRVNAAIWLVYAVVATITSAATVRGAAFLASTLAVPAVLCAFSIAVTPWTLARGLHAVIERALKTR